MKNANSEQLPAVQTEQPIGAALTPAEMLQSIVKGGITPENVAVFEKALDICERMEKRDSERRFNSAFVKLQSDIPTIIAKTPIKNRGKYEKFEDLMEVVGPILRAHGFSVSFSQPDQMPPGKMIEVCHLAHEGGHSRQHSCAIRTKKADDETQSDAMAMTTAKRNALIQALNIVIRQDILNNEHDAGIEGDPTAKVTSEQAFELERRVKETNSNLPAFLKLAKASTFADIPAIQYDILDALLRTKEARGR